MSARELLQVDAPVRIEADRAGDLLEAVWKSHEGGACASRRQSTAPELHRVLAPRPLRHGKATSTRPAGE